MQFVANRYLEGGSTGGINQQIKTPPILWYRQVAKCLELAIRCTDTKPTNRPDISDIICELNKVDSSSDVSDAAE
jgi:hypothetical protein